MTTVERYVLQKGIKGAATKGEKNNLVDQYILEKKDQQKKNKSNAADLDEDLEKKILQQIDKSITKALKDL